MLRIAQKLCVGAKSDLCEMFKLFIQENFHAGKSFWKIYPLKYMHIKINHPMKHDLYDFYLLNVLHK